MRIDSGKKRKVDDQKEMSRKVKAETYKSTRGGEDNAALLLTVKEQAIK
jgi:hypothetical protein